MQIYMNKLSETSCNIKFNLIESLVQVKIQFIDYNSLNLKLFLMKYFVVTSPVTELFNNKIYD